MVAMITVARKSRPLVVSRRFNQVTVTLFLFYSNPRASFADGITEVKFVYPDSSSYLHRLTREWTALVHCYRALSLTWPLNFTRRVCSAGVAPAAPLI
jgi:hypothetical protein